MALLSSLALHYPRRCLRVAVCIVLFVLCVDLLLTVEVYGRRGSPALAVGNSGLGNAEFHSGVHSDYGDGKGSAGGSGGSNPAHKDVGIALGHENGRQRQKEKLYIASIHWNDAAILATRWIPALLSLIEDYGAPNLYISILESGSWDDTRKLLRSLDSELETLGVERSIVLEERTHEDELKKTPAEGEKGWIWGTRGRRELRRIPYLAAERNRAMEPLRELAKRKGRDKRIFDRVVWLNDVTFTADQVTTLLATRNGSYAAVCALDFSVSNKIYDSFAVRDSLGAPPLTVFWPFFSSSASVSAITRDSPTPVKSCWNGLVIFNSAPFYSNPPLEFRGIDDRLAEKHVEGSECCLIHVDNQLSERKGVWINPNVRVAYNEGADKAVNGVGGWPTGFGRVEGVWANQWNLATGWYWRWRQTWVVDGAVKAWELEGMGRKEEGTFCLEDSMQVLVRNGWAHI